MKTIHWVHYFENYFEIMKNWKNPLGIDKRILEKILLQKWRISIKTAEEIAEKMNNFFSVEFTLEDYFLPSMVIMENGRNVSVEKSLNTFCWLEIIESIFKEKKEMKSGFACVELLFITAIIGLIILIFNF